MCTVDKFASRLTKIRALGEELEEAYVKEVPLRSSQQVSPNCNFVISRLGETVSTNLGIFKLCGSCMMACKIS